MRRVQMFHCEKNSPPAEASLRLRSRRKTSKQLLDGYLGALALEAQMPTPFPTGYSDLERPAAPSDRSWLTSSAGWPMGRRPVHRTARSWPDNLLLSTSARVCAPSEWVKLGGVYLPNPFFWSPARKPKNPVESISSALDSSQELKGASTPHATCVECPPSRRKMGFLLSNV